jgi:hypothetical protein
VVPVRDDNGDSWEKAMFAPLAWICRLVLVIDQFCQVVICVGIIIRGKSEPFPLDISDCLLSPFVFITEISKKVWKRRCLSYFLGVMTMNCFISYL